MPQLIGLPIRNPVAVAGGGGSSFTADLYVATTGNDSNAGTLVSPFRTLQKACNVVNPGQVVGVQDGTYIDDDVDDIVAHVTRGGTSWGSPVTFRAVNKWGAKLNGQANFTKHGWHVDASYVQIRDFDIYGMGGAATSQGADGVDVESSHVRVTGCRIRDIGRYCTDEPYGMDAILINGSSDVLVENCWIQDIGRFGPGESGCSPSTTIYQNNDHGIYVDASSDVTIRNTIFHSLAHGWAVHVFPSAVSNLLILNNVFAFPNTYRVGHIVLLADVTDAVIANNIFYNPTTAGIRYAGGTMTNVSARNNITNGGVVLWNDTNGTTTVSGITKTANQDSTDPLFVNTTLGTLDFHVQAGSPAIDNGVTRSEVLTDYDGVTRPVGSAYDIGAYER